MRLIMCEYGSCTIGPQLNPQIFIHDTCIFNCSPFKVWTGQCITATVFIISRYPLPLNDCRSESAVQIWWKFQVSEIIYFEGRDNLLLIKIFYEYRGAWASGGLVLRGECDCVQQLTACPIALPTIWRASALACARARIADASPV